MKTFDDIQEATPPKAGWKEGETAPPPHPDGIERAKIISKTDFMSMMMKGEELDERLQFVDHPTRQFLYWMILPKRRATS